MSSLLKKRESGRRNPRGVTPSADFLPDGSKGGENEMAKINVRTNDMNALQARLKKVSSVIVEAEQMAASAQRDLDFQVGAKAGIDSKLTKIRSELKNQSGKVTKMSSITALSEAMFKEADGKMNKQTQGILSKIKDALTNFGKNVTHFFASLLISHHTAVSNIFLTSGGILSSVAIADLIRRLREIIEKWKENPSGNTGHSSDEVRHDGVKPEGSGATQPEQSENASKPTQPEPSKPYEKLKRFKNSDYKGKLYEEKLGKQGDYSDYSIVSGMKPEFVIDQNVYPEAGFAAGGCVSSTCWTIAAAYRGTTNLNGVQNMKPTDSWNPVTEKTAGDTKTMNPATFYYGSCKYSGEDQYLKAIYYNLVNGTPIGVRTGQDEHTVSCIGLKNGTNIEDFKAQLEKATNNSDKKTIIDEFKKNILISDSSGGKIKTLAELGNNKLTPNMGLWYPDGATMLGCDGPKNNESEK